MKIISGKVVSTKMDKTATVAVERVVAHPVYKKRFRRVKKYHVHDEMGVKVGDIVKFSASRPFSKLKKWKVVEVLKSITDSGKTGIKSSKKGKLETSGRRKKKVVGKHKVK